jgi:uncharacterized protein YkwD
VFEKDYHLEETAKLHADYLEEANALSHSGRGGETLNQRVLK